MTDRVVELNANDNKTPEQALAVAARRPWETVIIAGYTEESDDLVIITSKVSRESALWIIRHLDLHVLGQLDD